MLQAALFVTTCTVSMLFGHAWLIDLGGYAGYLFGSVISSILSVSVMSDYNLICNDSVSRTIGHLDDFNVRRLGR